MSFERIISLEKGLHAEKQKGNRNKSCFPYKMAESYQV